MPERFAPDFSFYIETLGCPKNQTDSRQMRASLLRSGFRESRDADNADFILLNTCSFIRESQEETIETTFELLKLKEDKPVRVGMIGCFPQRFSSALSEEIPELDFFQGTGKYHEISDLLLEKYDIREVPHDGIRLPWNSAIERETPWAYFRIARGCSRSCAFCAIPSIRGSLTRYDTAELERQFEEEKNITPGREIREAILVSQDTISQGLDELEKMIEWFSGKDEVAWIRLQYLFPDKRMLALPRLFERYPKLVPYLDMPLQHVSAEVLRAMKRPDDTGLFSEILQAMRDVRPDMEVRTSFIMGFPGEEEKHVDEIEEFLEQHAIEKLALFRYSHEEGTPAGNSLEETVSEEEKIKRINRIRELHIDLRNERRELLKGRREQVILDGFSETDAIARRRQDSPEIDEVVLIPRETVPASLKTGDLFTAELQIPMEYDWMGEFISD